MLKKILKAVKYLVLAGVIVVIYSLLESYWIQTKVHNEISNDIPEEFNGKKIVFISDIHHKDYFSLGRLKSLVEEINSMKPDIILLGGDYVTVSRDYIEPCFNELKNLKAPLGTYGVLGNHDHWEDANLSWDSMRKAGITSLDNKAQWINSGAGKIKIGGVGDLWDNKQDISPTVKDTKESDFVIMLSHNPDYVERIRDKRIDLVLSGHTHGGQVTLFGFWSPFIPSAYGEKYRTGLVKTEYTKVLVTNGIGAVGYPARFWARPQINVIYLKNK